MWIILKKYRFCVQVNNQGVVINNRSHSTCRNKCSQSCYSPDNCPSGSAGPAGPQGEDGIFGTLAGSFGSLDELIAAIQTPVPTNFYLVGNELFHWDPSRSMWVSAGMIEGPAGSSGVTGPTGTAGNQGIPGSSGLQGLQGIIGPTGPSGIRGPNGQIGLQGAIGPTGPSGPNGVDGTIAGAFPSVSDLIAESPDPSQGNFYLVGTHLYYWDPSLNGWAFAGVIEGPRGMIGPTGIGGVQGIQGEQGSQGDRGPTGEIGSTGPLGIVGPDGSQGGQGPSGSSGPQGLQGFIGPMGKSGVTGTLAGGFQSLDDLKIYGDPTPGNFYLVNNVLYTFNPQTSIWESVGYIQGPEGSPGPTGPIGPTGISGLQGEEGIEGSIGDTGLMGIMGLTGPLGPYGSQGPIGPTGPTGTTGPYGAEGPMGEPGNIGTIHGVFNSLADLEANGIPQAGFFYVIGQDVYSWNDETGNWEIEGPIGLIGMDGEIGPQGPMGPTGPTGLQGITGEIGPQGPLGPQGTLGPTGNTGIQGGIGAQGEIGPMGITGETGNPGEIGITGPQGPSGICLCDWDSIWSELTTIQNRIDQIQLFNHQTRIYNACSIDEMLLGLCTSAISIGNNYNLWGEGELDTTQDFDARSGPYYLLHASQLPPLECYQGGSTLGTLWIKTPDGGVYTMPLYFDADGIYFYNFTMNPIHALAGTTFNYTQLLILDCNAMAASEAAELKLQLKDIVVKATVAQQQSCKCSCSPVTKNCRCKSKHR